MGPAALFPAVIAGHAIGDWIVQTDAQAAQKSRSWAKNQGHILTYHLTMVACVVALWHTWPALVALAVSWVTHSIIDRRWPVRRLMELTGSGPFSQTTWGVLVVDQALHLSILALLVAYLGGPR